MAAVPVFVPVPWLRCIPLGFASMYISGEFLGGGVEGRRLRGTTGVVL